MHSSRFCIMSVNIIFDTTVKYMYILHVHQSWNITYKLLKRRRSTYTVYVVFRNKISRKENVLKKELSYLVYCFSCLKQINLIKKYIMFEAYRFSCAKFLSKYWYIQYFSMWCFLSLYSFKEIKIQCNL